MKAQFKHRKLFSDSDFYLVAKNQEHTYIVAYAINKVKQGKTFLAY